MAEHEEDGERPQPNEHFAAGDGSVLGTTQSEGGVASGLRDAFRGPKESRGLHERVAVGRRSLAEVIRTPTRNRAVVLHGAGVTRPVLAGAYRAEQPGGRAGLSLVVLAPASNLAVDRHTAGVGRAHADRAEDRSGRPRLALVVVPPARHGAIGLQSARGTAACADGTKRTTRRCCGVVTIAAPARDRTVGPDRARMLVADADLAERSGRRLLRIESLNPPADHGAIGLHAAGVAGSRADGLERSCRGRRLAPRVGTEADDGVIRSDAARMHVTCTDRAVASGWHSVEPTVDRAAPANETGAGQHCAVVDATRRQRFAAQRGVFGLSRRGVADTVRGSRASRQDARSAARRNDGNNPPGDSHCAIHGAPTLLRGSITRDLEHPPYQDAHAEEDRRIRPFRRPMDAEIVCLLDRGDSRRRAACVGLDLNAR